jgi:DNA sulfur modification protein DndD
MWIARLELQNFKSYQHQVFEFPRPEQDRHIVLIGGKNAYGKTTLLEALYLCLYGKDAMPHLARAGLRTERGYPSFLERALHGHARAIGRDSMSVTVRIADDRDGGLQVARRWFFKPNGDWNPGDEVVLHTLRRGTPDRALPSVQLTEHLDRQFIPAHIAPFFFFDGEEVKKLADQERVEQVKQGMEGLLGVTLLRELHQRLEKFQRDQKANKGGTTEPGRVKQLEATMRRQEEECERLREEKKDRERTLAESKGRRQELMDQVLALGGGGGDIATVKDIMEEKGPLRRDREALESELAGLLADRLPFHLMRADLRDELVRQWMAELERGRWEARRDSMEPDRRHFIDNFFGLTAPPLEPPLTPAQDAALRERIDQAWQGLFYPVPEGCAQEVVHRWLHDGQKTAALDSLRGLQLGGRTVLAAVQRLGELRERERVLDYRLTKVEGIDRDGALARIKEELVKLNVVIDEAEHALGDVNRQLTGITAKLAEDRATYAREHERLVRTAPARSNIAKAERVRTLISALIPELYALKTRRLSDAMTSAFGHLAHTPWFDRIVVDELGRSRLFSKEGGEVDFDKSAGENQLFVTALLAGLAEVSGINAPLVVDTPLGRLDVQHRQNILDFWLSDKRRQVILLSQDAEIGEELFNRLQPAIARTYLLHHEVIGQGVSKTVAYPDRYFDFGRTAT